MELMEERDEGTGIALGCLLPINALALKVSGTKDRLTLAVLGLMDFARGFRSLPASLSIGSVAQGGFVGEQDGYVLFILL
jgi:hypothetical protein